MRLWPWLHAVRFASQALAEGRRLLSRLTERAGRCAVAKSVGVGARPWQGMSFVRVRAGPLPEWRTVPVWGSPHAFLQEETANDFGGVQDCAPRSRASVAQGWIVDVSGKCPGFASLPSFNKGVLNRNSTLSKILWEREAEIARRAKEEG